jgi:hypothetical protein
MTASTSKLMLAVTMLSVSALAADVANAGGRPRSGQSVHRTTTHTGPQGNTSTRVHDRTITDNGFKRSTTVTGPKGKTASTNAVVQKTDDGYTRDVTRTGPNGKTSSTTRTVTKTPAQP